MTNRGLEIELDPDFQRLEWRLQRLGVALLFLFVLAAMLGLTGHGGPFSHAEAGRREDGVHLEYERIVRRGAPSTMTLHLRRGAPGQVRFWISAPYLEHVQVETVTPTPTLVSAGEGRHVYALQAGETGAGDITVTIQVAHTTIGRVQGEIGLAGGASARFSQLSFF